jgi:hypothetical protein
MASSGVIALCVRERDQTITEEVKSMHCIRFGSIRQLASFQTHTIDINLKIGKERKSQLEMNA